MAKVGGYKKRAVSPLLLAVEDFKHFLIFSGMDFKVVLIHWCSLLYKWLGFLSFIGGFYPLFSSILARIVLYVNRQFKVFMYDNKHKRVVVLVSQHRCRNVLLIQHRRAIRHQRHYIIDEWVCQYGKIAKSRWWLLYILYIDERDIVCYTVVG